MYKRSAVIVCILLLFSSSVYAVPQTDRGKGIVIGPRFYQWQSPWGNSEQYPYAGKPGKTLAKSGCLVTSLSMLLRYWGMTYIPNVDHDPEFDPRCAADPAFCSTTGIFLVTNPGTLNNWFTKNGLYNGNGDLDPATAVKRFYLRYPYSGSGYRRVVPNYDCPNNTKKTCYKTDWGDKARELLDYDLDHGNPAIMKIEWVGLGGDRHESHFVLAAGYDDASQTYRAYDPNQRYDIEKPIPPSLNVLYKDKGLGYTELRVDRYDGEARTLGLPRLSYVTATALSPVELQFIDPDGHVTGYDPATGTQVVDIAYSNYSQESVSSTDPNDPEPEPSKVLHVDKPIAGNYLLKMTGTGDGPYTLIFESAKEDGSENLKTSLTGTATRTLSETYRVTYSPTGEATVTNMATANQAPVANAGSDQTGEQSYEITLDGSGSADPDGDPLQYRWEIVSKPVGSTAALSSASEVSPRFTPDLLGTYVMQLVVNDHFTDSAPSPVTITATPVQSRISVTPNDARPLAAGSGVLSFDVNNTGRAGVANGMLDITIKDPDGVTIYSGTQTFSITVGQTKAVDAPVTIPALKFGNYTLTYTQSDETKTGSPTTVTIANSVLASFSFDKSSYRVRDTANLTLTLMNTGKFNLDAVTVSVAAPDAGYAETRTLSIGTGQAQPMQYAIPIPDTIVTGQHDVSLISSLVSGSSITMTEKLTVPMSLVGIEYSGPSIVTAGDIINLTIENHGGTDTSYATDDFALTDGMGAVIYRDNLTGSILAGEKKLLKTIEIPQQIANGLIYLKIKLRDNRSNSVSYFEKPIPITGVATASVQTRTEKDVYLSTEPITGISSILTGSAGLDGGSLRVAVNRAHVVVGQFSRFLPKTGWWPISAPAGVAVGADGAVYVTDTANNRIQKFDGTGTFIGSWGSTGSGDGSFNQPSGITVAPDGSVYVADAGNNRIQKFDGSGRFNGKFGGYGTGNGLFNYPNAVAVASDGSIYVVDTYNHRIQKFNSSGAFVVKWGGYGSGNGQFNYPYGIAVASDGSIYVADTSNDRVQKFDANGAFIAKVGSSGQGDGQFSSPTDIEVGSDGFVYVVDSSNNRVQKLDGSGNFISKLLGPFYYPKGVAVASDGALYVADTGNNSIQKVDGSGQLLAKWGSSGSGNGEFRSPRDITVAGDGSLYLLDTDNHRVQKINKDGTFGVTWGSLGGGDGQFNSPYGIAVAPDGSIYVADTWNHRIQKFDANGNFIAKWGAYGTGNGQFNGPFGIAVGPDGVVHVVDTYNKRIQKFDGNGNFIGKWVGSSWTWSGDYPWRIAVGADNVVYVIDGGWNKYNWDYRVQKFDASGTLISTIRWNIYEYLTDIAVAPDNTLYLSDDAYSLIRQLNVSGQLMASWGSRGSGDGQFRSPWGMAVGSDGSVYVAEAENSRIQKMIFSTTGSETLFEMTTPITQPANNGQDYLANIGTVDARGKLYLEASVKNSLGQRIATAEYPFYIVGSNAVLSFSSNKKTYTPYETITITGEVANRTSMDVIGLSLSIKSQSTAQNSTAQSLYTETFNLAANGTHPFTITTTAGVVGTMVITGVVSQNGMTMSDVSDQYEVVNPSMFVTMTAPDVVGRKPFDVDVEVRNTGKVDASVQYAISRTPGDTIDNQPLSLAAGEATVLHYTQQVTADTTYSVVVSGDVSQSAAKTVAYGEGAQIQFGGDGLEFGVHPAGMIAIPVTISNTGQMDETVDVIYSLQPSALNQTRSYYLPQGGSVTDRLYYDLTVGSYQVSGVSSAPYASAALPLTVATRDSVTMSTSVGNHGADGFIPVTVNLTNNGSNEINGAIRLAVMNNQGKAVWRGEVLVSGLSPQTSQNYQININAVGIMSGVYNADIILDNTSGRQLAVNQDQVRISGPIFEVTSVPASPSFTVGREAVLNFSVKNTGTLDGMTTFTVKAMGVLNQSVTDVFVAGEERPYAFRFVVPEDAEAGDYAADYALSPIGSQASTGQAMFHVVPVKMNLTASLDKDVYRPGDTAVVTLTVSKAAPFRDGAYVAGVRYGGSIELREFTLSDQASTLTFSVPLADITGEPLFSHVQFESGRSIVTQHLAINQGQPDLIIQNFSAGPISVTTYRIEATATNLGETASEPTMLAIYNGEAFAGGQLLGTFNIGSLGSGGTQSVALDWNVMGSGGDQLLYAVVDPSNSVVEFSEANNAAAITVSIAPVALDLSLGETTYSSGEVVSIVGSATNRSADVTYQGADVVTSVTNASGLEVSREVRTVDLAPVSVTSTSVSWNTTGVPLGIYTVTQTILYNQASLASAQTSLTLNNTVPTAQLLTPVGGETITGTYGISWQAADPDGQTLTIDIAYSGDGGVNWVYITTDEVNDGAYSWPTASLPDGANYRIKIIAKDGMATATAQSGAVTLLNSGALKINSIPAGANVYLDGTYGYLGAYQGVTGVNIASLRAGRHVLRLAYPGYQEHYQLVDVMAGQETQVMVTLIPMTSVAYTDAVLISSQGVSLDVGSYSTPFVVDWTMDGKKDLVVGNDSGQIMYFENTGTDAVPAFDSPPTTILTGDRYLAPFVVDWDNDGRNDLIVGNANGEVIFLKNVGTDGTSSFGPGSVIAKVSDSAIPFVVDYDEDHKKDLLIGAGDGTLQLYLNYGSDAQPVFHAFPDSLVLTVGGSIAPFVVTDWDGDGRKDLLAGSRDGSLSLYLNDGTNAAPHFGAGQPISGSSGPLYAGLHSTPFVIDFNNDGLRDLVVGNAGGEISLFPASEAVLSATIDVDPNTLSRSSKGQWVTVYVELPSGGSLSEIDGMSLRLQGVIPAESQPMTIGDHDGDGTPDLMVKFDRHWLQSVLSLGHNIKVTLTGRLKGVNRSIKGDDHIVVIE